MKSRNESGSQLEASRQHPVAAGEPGHDEWLLDESIEETFPASDATLPIRPGSALSRRPRESSTDTPGSSEPGK